MILGCEEMGKDESPERTTIRLDPELAQRLDAFLFRHKEYDSRSQAMRAAVEEFLDRREKPEAGDKGALTVRLPPSIMNALQTWVKSDEHFVDMDDALRHIIRDYLTQHVHEVSESIRRLKVVSGEALDVSLEESEGKRR
ncbi:MAG TPA: ribbon-helix-helix domain-containing protein [Thermoplasmata archaeon]|nr:ribbon-helix-helix domain-containing protein [Thermoplasmata archaeon]